jgi:excinuclease ABC subunit B
VEGLAEIDPLRATVLRRLPRVTLFPASHYVTRQGTLERATRTIGAELKARIAFFRDENRLIEAQRIEERTHFDLEMMLELGYCNGIENYSRHLTGRAPGAPPPTLFDYFPPDLLLCIDESHIAVPQLRAMYRGDRSRKETLVNFGFRLPSALDNRPLRFEEFETRIGQAIFVSATPAEYELQLGGAHLVEQIARPTGLVDPLVEVRPAANQVDDLYAEIRRRQERNERVLVTTLTKRMAEELSDYYAEMGLQVRYLHSDIGTLERIDIIRDLRLGTFSVLIGINLLREGLDIPEVSLVAILDADKEGFLRSARALIQTFGRAARNRNGRVILYADKTTPAMAQAISETDRRRTIQEDFNRRHGITPRTVTKEIGRAFDFLHTADAERAPRVAEAVETFGDRQAVEQRVAALEQEMRQAARDLEFELAARLRDRIRALRQALLV